MSTIVDVLYRGVPLAQQVPLAALTQVQAMVPHAAPMPVGTPLAVRVGDAAPIDVVVVGVREAHGEADATAAGMLIAPVAGAAAAAKAIWDQVVAGAPAADAPAVGRRGTDELAATQVAEATATAAAVARAAAIEPGAEPRRRTRELSSQEVAAVAQAAGTVAEPIRPVRASKPPEVRKAEEAARAAAAGAVAADGIVDDGKATTVMEAVSPELLAQLGLEPGASGAMAASDGAPVESDGDGDGASASVSAPTAAGGDKGGKSKKKSKKR